MASAEGASSEASSARALLQDAAQAMGRSDSLKSLGTLDLQMLGTAVEVGQSASPDAPFTTVHASIHRVLDLAGRRSMQELHTAFRGNLALAIREVVTDSAAFTLELSTHTLYPIAAAARTGANETTRELFPQLLVAQAAAIPDSAWGTGSRKVGTRSEDGIRVREVGQENWLWFDHETHRIASVENVRSDPSGHTMVSATRYDDYAPVQSLWLPHHIVREVNGQMSTDLRVTALHSLRGVQDKWFALPKGAYPGPELGGAVHVSLDSIAPGVYVARSGVALKGNFFFNPLFIYTSLVVCWDTSVTVIETPVGNGVSRAVIAALHSRFPGRPIRYACPTHYHGDHMGGIGAFVDSGATAVTTPGNRGAVAGRIARGAGGEDSIRAWIGIETFTGRREIGVGVNRVLLLEVPNTHVDEMVVAWLPGPKILFVSDLFEIVGAHAPDRLSPPNPCVRALWKAIHAEGLEPRLIVSGHGRVAPGSELSRMVAAGHAR